jgi:hypothetical protein
LQERCDRCARLLSDLELHRPLRLLLDDDGACLDHAADGDVLDPKARQIAGAEFAVDGKIEEREIAAAALQLQRGANGSHLLLLERRLLADEPAGCDASTSRAPWWRRMEINIFNHGGGPSARSRPALCGRSWEASARPRWRAVRRRRPPSNRL